MVSTGSPKGPMPVNSGMSEAGPSTSAPAAAAATPTAPRGRGRPPGTTKAAMAARRAADGIAPGAPIPSPKAVSTNSDGVKRGRGRPPGTTKEAMAARRAAGEVPSAPKLPKQDGDKPRGRGRPPGTTKEAMAARREMEAAMNGDNLAASRSSATPNLPGTPKVPTVSNATASSSDKPAPTKSSNVAKNATSSALKASITAKTVTSRAAAGTKRKAEESEDEDDAPSSPSSSEANSPEPSASTTRAIPTAKRAAEKPASASTPRKRGRPSTSTPKALPSFDDEAFGKTPDLMSRDKFLLNERLRRQREARNFNFDGDASAPRQTRSGRVVVERQNDEYGGERVGRGARAESEEPRLEPREDSVPEEEQLRTGSITPLPPHARSHVLRILATLTNRESSPAPFADENGHETLQGLLSLLRGTVERGEGNSALVTGPRGAGKTKTVERALDLLPSTSKCAPIVVRLSGHAQTDDRRAIREMGRQIAEAEGRDPYAEDDEEDTGADYAPTTLPSHLLALLTQPSPRAIIIIMDEFDLFTEHARQALLYCLLDVVQSVQTGPVETTSRGVAVIGMTSRVDTLLLLEKRVKSRFSHRVWRVTSPLAPGAQGWKALLHRALIPWDETEESGPDSKWMGDWAFAVDMLLGHDRIAAKIQRLVGLTTDVRLLYRPFIGLISSVLSGDLDFLSVARVYSSISAQLELSGWNASSTTTNPNAATANTGKLRGLPHPALGVLIIAKHLAYAGRNEFSFAQVEDEYLRFARTRLVGSGRARWPLPLLRRGFDHCRTLGLLAPAGPATAGPRFAKVRSSLPPHEVVAYFRGDGGAGLGPELAGWGRMSGGHA